MARRKRHLAFALLAAAALWIAANSAARPPEGTLVSSAASLGATVRLVDRSGRFVLKSLDDEEEDSRGPRKP